MRYHFCCYLAMLLCSSYRTGMGRSSRPEVFLGKGVLKICSKFTGEHPCRNAISINLQSNFIEIALRHVCSPVNLQHIFRTPFPRNTSGWLLLNFIERDSGTIVFLLFQESFFFIERLRSVAEEHRRNH